MSQLNAARLSVSGIGLVSPLGRGPGEHCGADFEQVGMEVESGINVCRIPPERLKDKDVLRGMRRADRFSKMATLAAHDAFADAGCAVEDFRDDIAVILTTAFGPHETTFAFLDEIIDYGDAEVSPTRFSHSVHNAAASYVAKALKSRGPTCTIADFDAPLHAGLSIAELWMRSGRCKSALVGYVEEISTPMNYALSTQPEARQNNLLPPFSFVSPAGSAIGEGGLFLALSMDAAGKSIDVERFTGPDKINDVGSLLKCIGSK